MKTRKNTNDYCAYRKKTVSAILKSMTKKLKSKKPLKYTEDDEKRCKQTFLNPTCKGTFFEAGRGFSKEFIKAQKMDKYALKMYNEERKEVFGNKTNVLDNGFYEKLPKKYINKLKKHGAISACTRFELWPNTGR